VRFSVWPSFQRPWDELLHLARHVEATGWHGLWFADHYMADTHDGTPSDHPALECWTTLGALGAAVARLQLGSLVSPSSVHHPALLAKQATTVDEVASGRLVLGIGAGWQVNEHRAYGFALAPPRERVDRFAEFIEVLRGLLREERTTFHGRWFDLEDAPCQPKGADGPIPIMVGTPSPRMLRLTARFADVWNGWGTPGAVRERLAMLDAACAAEGRDPSTVRRTAQGLFLIGGDPAFVEAVRAQAPADRVVAGSDDQLVDAVGQYAEAGIDELIVPDFTLGRTAAERLDSYDRFRADVAGGFVRSADGPR
jgi:alkanesulfonate monooxygenase SsuD/methylene tetrahydromethanopterin reductase-like flavin-dependent oxidoreductase (luciferase family)